jgi:hypothetical protein
MTQPEIFNSAEFNLRELALQIREDKRLDAAYAAAAALLRTGFTAGGRYPEIWIRDLATFTRASAQQGQMPALKEHVLTFFAFQQPDGSILDGIVPKAATVDAYNYFTCPQYPGLFGHKNSTETDQESSLIHAVREIVEADGKPEFALEQVDGQTVLQRIDRAIGWVYRERWSTEHGLAWNATTIDWGDGQACRDWEEIEVGVPANPAALPNLTEFGPDSHPAICIYTNAFLRIALLDRAWLATQVGEDPSPWQAKADALAGPIRRVLWDHDRRKYRPHVYLERGSPFPDHVDEAAIHYHGGTATAMLAGLLDRDDAAHCYATMKANVAAAGAQSVGLTIWPLYDVPELNNTLFWRPFYYQNGGDWPWWGARVPLGLLACGLPAQAYESLLPILKMIETSGGFFEWHKPDGTPQGSPQFRGAAGVVYEAIERLRTWAT